MTENIDRPRCKDIHGNEENIYNDVTNICAPYSRDQYTNYGGFRHIPTGEVYLFKFGGNWKVTGHVLWDSSTDTYTDTQIWEWGNKDELRCFVYHILKIDKEEENWEKIQFNLQGSKDQSHHTNVKNGYCSEAGHGLKVDYEWDVALTNGETKRKHDSIRLGYYPPWPYPSEWLKVQMTDIKTGPMVKREADKESRYEKIVLTIDDIQEV